jgi:hypothetical protein
MHCPGLTSHLGQFSWIGDRLRSVVEIAPTARRQAHSSFIPGLENTQHAEPDGQEQAEAPQSGSADREKNDCGRRGHSKRHEAGGHSPLLAAGADVRDLGDGDTPNYWGTRARTAHSKAMKPRTPAVILKLFS